MNGNGSCRSPTRISSISTDWVQRPLSTVLGAQFVLAHRRVLAAAAAHVILIAASNIVAFWLRFDGKIPTHQLGLLYGFLPMLVIIRSTALGWFGLYRGLWRYTDIWDLRDILASVVTSSLLFYGVVTWVAGVGGYPRSVVLIDALVLILMMAGLRLTRRVAAETVLKKTGREVLVIGAGNAGEMTVRDMKKHRTYTPIGFVDDDPRKAESTIHGVPVLGNRAELPRIMEEYRPAEVLMAMPGTASSVKREIVRALEPYTTRITTLPSLTELVDGKVDASQVRQLAIEDLLSRAPIDVDTSRLRGLIKHRRILITGAGGSIGSELSRQVAALGPASLILYERYENSLHYIASELADTGAPPRVTACVGDITDVGRLDGVMTEHTPHVVFHAAAHKHVPLMEANPCEAVKNNIRGTRLLSEAAERHGVDRFILISSDKAVNPTSVMGATKRAAELYVQAKAVGSDMSFLTVRFGNVLGSNGSVLLRFVDQIKDGGPVTVTDPKISRYFMLIPEAVGLVLQAAARGETGGTYVLEMGEPMLLLDLARNLIRVSGFGMDEIPIRFTGLRPGEKMFEELVGANETIQPSGIESVNRVASCRPPDPDTLVEQLLELERLAISGETDAVFSLLRTIEPRFRTIDSDAVAECRPKRPQPLEIPTSSTLACPACGSRAFHRSHAKTIFARLRRRFTVGRPYHCHACDWREWLEPGRGPERNAQSESQTESPDFIVIDQALKSHFHESRYLHD